MTRFGQIALSPASLGQPEENSGVAWYIAALFTPNRDCLAEDGGQVAMDAASLNQGPDGARATGCKNGPGACARHAGEVGNHLGEERRAAGAKRMHQEHRRKPAFRPQVFRHFRKLGLAGTGKHPHQRRFASLPANALAFAWRDKSSDQSGIRERIANLLDQNMPCCRRQLLALQKQFTDRRIFPTARCEPHHDMWREARAGVPQQQSDIKPTANLRKSRSNRRRNNGANRYSRADFVTATPDKIDQVIIRENGRAGNDCCGDVDPVFRQCEDHGPWCILIVGKCLRKRHAHLGRNIVQEEGCSHVELATPLSYERRQLRFRNGSDDRLNPVLGLGSVRPTQESSENQPLAPENRLVFNCRKLRPELV